MKFACTAASNALGPTGPCCELRTRTISGRFVPSALRLCCGLLKKFENRVPGIREHTSIPALNLNRHNDGSKGAVSRLEAPFGLLPSLGPRVDDTVQLIVDKSDKVQF